MPVHAFGHMADMEGLVALSGELGIPLIEDAACAFGSSQGGRSAGLWGDFGVFSFHPRKIVTTGEGGMVIASDSLNEQRARLARTHGAKREGLFAEFDDFGFNFRISEMQAAIGTVQLERSRDLLATRRRNATSLLQLLDGTPGARLPSEKPGFTHSFQSFVVLLDKSISRDKVVRRMADQGIETTLGTYSMSSQKSFSRYRGDDPAKNLANSHFAFQQALSIPLHTKLSDTDLETINSELRSALASCGV
jgi:dTDP-4-amino-4,6-dideoxygalactose transaminase